MPHNHHHNRSFSFEERPLSSIEQEHPTHHHHTRNQSNHSTHSTHQPYHDSPSPPTRPSRASQSSQFSPIPLPDDNHVTPVSPPSQRYHPSAHPDSIFAQTRRAHNESQDSGRHRHSSSSQPASYQDRSQTPPPPPPPQHRKPVGQPPSARLSGQDQGYTQPSRPLSTFTLDMDNFGQGQSGRSMDRVRDTDDGRRGDAGMPAFPDLEASSSRRSQVLADSSGPSTPSDQAYLPQRPAEASRNLRPRGSYSSSTIPIAAGAATPGSITPILPPSDGSGQSFPLTDYQSRQTPTTQSPYHDSPYQNSSLHFAPQFSQVDINPQNIADDGDDGFMPVPKRKSMLGMRGPSSHEAGATAAAGGVAAGGFMGALSGLAGRKQKGQTASGTYDPVGQAGNVENGGTEAAREGLEKSEWLSRQTKGNNKMRWVVGGVIGLVIVLAIIGGILGGVLGSRSAARSGGSTGRPAANSINNAEDDTAANGDLNQDSAEIQQLMNHADLHKVFPAMDYTPWGVQYPLCEEYPPSQNNITRDLAVLSQLTNTVRLYGTDCNQTEMVLHSIDRLGLTSMRVWLGVWIETNTTTNDRQLEQMYQILEDVPDHSIFKGVIVGNEALYRAGVDKAASLESLIEILTEVRSNFTSLGYDLPVATSDLGDNWTADLVQAVDVVMSNIHPFFAGVPVDEAAGWTWNFWQTRDAPLTQGTDKPQIISETGWPSGGGNDCGTLETECATPESGSVAGVDEMNVFMEDFVCQALDNGTDYFWFEAFDEPWKVVYNTPGQEWEDKWGLMDPARNLKPGLRIPDCGGRTVS